METNFRRVEYVYDVQMNLNFYDGVQIKYLLQYRGPDGKARLPKFSLINSKDETTKACVASGDADSYAIAIGFEGESEITFVTGQTLSQNPMILLFDVPKNDRYRLVFDDLSPVPIIF